MDDSSLSKIVNSLLLVFLLLPLVAVAGPDEQARRIHERIAGVPPDAGTAAEMSALITAGDVAAAADIAMTHPDFYRTTLKNLATPWTNRDGDVFAPLNDYSATFIGLVRDDRDFRELLTGSVLYVGEVSGIPGYAPDNNNHYEALEAMQADLGAVLTPRPQSSLNGIPDSAAAGVMTSRAASRAFFIAGTNRAMLRFTLLNHLCRDLEQVADTTRVPDRIRQDVTRSPGGDSRLFRNNCIGCHSGMDPLAQAFAYYNFSYDAANDPTGVAGRLTYNDVGTTDAVTGSRVVAKYHINSNNFPFGYVTPDDTWDNYWRDGQNALLGWDTSLPGTGSGATSLGEELANSDAFASCQVERVFRTVCLRDPQDAADRALVASMSESFTSGGYRLRPVFASTAAYCMGD